MQPIPSSTALRAMVLLVEDEAVLRRLLSRMLTEAGFGVVDAEDGQRALEIARAFDSALALVVTDLHMPVMSGLEFAREFRLLHPSVPLLFISGRDLPETLGSEIPGDGESCENPSGLRPPRGSRPDAGAVSRCSARAGVAPDRSAAASVSPSSDRHYP